MDITEAYFRLAHPLLNSLFRVIVVMEIIEAYCLNRLSRVLVVMEIIEAYFRLASPLLHRFEKQILLRTTSWRRRMMRGDGDHRSLLRLAPPLSNHLFHVVDMVDVVDVVDAIDVVEVVD